MRKSKENKPVVAICYDFDKTLTPDDMQAQGYIQKVYGDDVQSFWEESNKLAEDNEMDSNLAYMFKMVQEAEGREILSKKNLEKYGAKVSLFPGVKTWFDRIKLYADSKGIIVEHYIISSGLNDRGVAVWPAQVINYTNKTQFLFRIVKGVLDANDSGVNDFFAPEEIRIPFRNMIYIGDSDTDIPCMKLVNSYGGHSIGVYNNDSLDKSKVYKMLRDNRIKYFAPADYTEGSELDDLVKAIIDRTVTNEILETIHYKCKEEQERRDLKNQNDILKKEKLDLIMSLNGSSSFATTHIIIEKLESYEEWDEEEKYMLIDVALKNTQVRYILNDIDVKKFYKAILKTLPEENEKVKQIIKEFKRV